MPAISHKHTSPFLQLGKKTQAWMLRSTDPLQCAVGALHMHLLEMLSGQQDDINYTEPDDW
jgi:hypothetical protein